MRPLLRTSSGQNQDKKTATLNQTLSRRTNTFDRLNAHRGPFSGIFDWWPCQEKKWMGIRHLSRDDLWTKTEGIRFGRNAPQIQAQEKKCLRGRGQILWCQIVSTSEGQEGCWVAGHARG